MERTERMSATSTWAANPTILRLTSRLKPTMTAIETSMTERLRATAVAAMRTITPGRFSSEGRAMRRAMKQARFTVLLFFSLFDAK